MNAAVASTIIAKKSLRDFCFSETRKSNLESSRDDCEAGCPDGIGLNLLRSRLGLIEGLNADRAGWTDADGPGVSLAASADS